ncbi:unnamed protein product [Protopolystoma xenopodis]|uniref:Uncharacterized protein n=1 Tax=Protopolystoma xenopodis TaxID=117903 RepID=A0A448X8B8_9PLAT|nr:unnamed protein product [Protopolystoma xenopodis]
MHHRPMDLMVSRHAAAMPLLVSRQSVTRHPEFPPPVAGVAGFRGQLGAPAWPGAVALPAGRQQHTIGHHLGGQLPTSESVGTVLMNQPASSTSVPMTSALTATSAGSVVGGAGPDSFFTSQMTAFNVWLQTADEKKPPATQLPILLQVIYHSFLTVIPLVFLSVYSGD